MDFGVEFDKCNAEVWVHAKDHVLFSPDTPAALLPGHYPAADPAALSSVLPRLCSASRRWGQSRAGDERACIIHSLLATGGRHNAECLYWSTIF